MKSTVVVFVILLAACESDEAKAARLQGDLTTAQLVYQSQSAKCDSILAAESGHARNPLFGPKSRACGDTLVRRRAELDVAQRAYNKFMHR